MVVSPVGDYEVVSPNGIGPDFKVSGSVMVSSTTYAYRNKYTSYLQNSGAFRADYVPVANEDTYNWYWYDVWVDNIDTASEWLVCATGYSPGSDQLGVTVVEGGGGFALKLYSFNYSGGLVPENYVIQGTGSSTLTKSTRIRIAIRTRFNNASPNTMDCEVWAKEAGGSWVKEISASGINFAGGSWWADAKDQQWTISQFERTAGKGGADFDVYRANRGWCEEDGSGIYQKRSGPELPPLACDDDYAVVAHPMYGDTDDAARDDYTIADGKTKKYQDVDDAYVASGAGTYIYNSSTSDEQEMKCKDHVVVGGGSATVEAVYIYAEIRNSSDGGAPYEMRVALHGTAGGAWTPAIYDSMFAIFKLDASGERRIYGAYAIVFGKDLDTPTDNTGTRADQTPSGEVTSFGIHAAGSGGSDLSFLMAEFLAPPEVAAPAAAFIPRVIMC